MNDEPRYESDAALLPRQPRNETMSLTNAQRDNLTLIETRLSRKLGAGGVVDARELAAELHLLVRSLLDGGWRDDGAGERKS